MILWAISSCTHTPGARDASRQSRVDFRVGPGRARHGVRLRYAQDVAVWMAASGSTAVPSHAAALPRATVQRYRHRYRYRVRRARPPEVMARAAAAVRVSRECRVLIPHVPGGVHLHTTVQPY